MPQPCRNRRCRNHRAAFTLVELLVVIGIIALLISMLLPALNRAREAAKRIACAAQLRQVGVATINYSINNRGALPPMNMDDGSPTYDSYSGGPVNVLRTIAFVLWGNISETAAADGGYSASTAEGATFTDKNNQNPVRGSSIGRLAAQNYLSGDIRRTAMCPAMNFAPANTDIAYAPNPNVYNYNFHWVALDHGGGTYNIQPIRKLAKYKTPKGSITTIDTNSGHGGTYASSYYDYEWALAIDPMMNTTTDSAGFASHHMGSSRAYNLLYTDGSVRTAIVPDKYTRQSMGSYQAFLDMAGKAESYANGSTLHAISTIYPKIPVVQSN